MTRAARPRLKIDVVVASSRWKDADKATAVMRRAVTRAAAVTPSTNGLELAIVLTDDSAIRLLNRDWRGIDAATNVLSFPAKNAAGKRNKHLGNHLGDIVLAYGPWRGKRAASTSHLSIISPILPCTASCIWPATITRMTGKRRGWSGPSVIFSASSRFRTRTGRRRRLAPNLRANPETCRQSQR
jgi:ssRNA-specific RNase YbeY (16S rRNA maturation enzyme)